MFFLFFSVFGVEMSIRLHKEYTSELSDAASPAYKDLKSMIDPVVSLLLTQNTKFNLYFQFLYVLLLKALTIFLLQLEEQYEGITGFVGVFVKQFRYGMVIFVLTKITHTHTKLNVVLLVLTEMEA